MVKNGNKKQNTAKINRSSTVHQVNKTLKTSGAEGKIMRRSVTIEPVLHDYVIELRGWLGMEQHLDVDYTTVLNMLAKLGAFRFKEWEKLGEEEKTIVLDTLELWHQKKESIDDELWTRRLRIELPEYDPEPIEEESQTNGAEGKQEKISHS